MVTAPEIDPPAPAIAPRRANRWIPFVMWAHVVLVLAAVASVYYKADQSRQVTAHALAVYSKVTAFSLTDSTNAPFGSADLEGYAWIASFSAADDDKVSRLVNRRMEEMQDVIANAPRAKLVTFSLFPERETPERLEAFAKKHRKSGQWVFLTGDRAEIARVMSEGFRLPRAAGGEGADGPLPAVDRLILIDRAGNIRGYYDSARIEEMRQLAQDIGETFE